MECVCIHLVKRMKEAAAICTTQQKECSQWLPFTHDSSILFSFFLSIFKRLKTELNRWRERNLCLDHGNYDTKSYFCIFLLLFFHRAISTKYAHCSVPMHIRCFVMHAHSKFFISNDFDNSNFPNEKWDVFFELHCFEGKLSAEDIFLLKFDEISIFIDSTELNWKALACNDLKTFLFRHERAWVSRVCIILHQEFLCVNKSYQIQLKPSQIKTRQTKPNQNNKQTW